MLCVHNRAKRTIQNRKLKIPPSCYIGDSRVASLRATRSFSVILAHLWLESHTWRYRLFTMISIRFLSIVTIPSLMLMVVSCASQPRFKWHKKGSTAESFQVDQAACQSQVRAQLAAEGDFTQPVGRTPAAERQLRKQARANELMVQCMEAAGYKRVTVE